MSEINYKTPMFRVKIKKPKTRKGSRRRKGSSVLKILEIKNQDNYNKKKGYYKCEGVNLYMTSGPPKKIPEPPKELLRYIKQQNFEFEDIKQSNNNKSIAYSEETDIPKKRKKINEFMAFRSYYSRFFRGIVPQLELSRILAQLWHEKPKMKRTWEMFAEHYNMEQPDQSFPEWLEKTYTSSYTPKGKVKIDDDQDEKSKHPYVEDLYLNTGNNGGNTDLVHKLNTAFNPNIQKSTDEDVGVPLNNLLFTELDLFHLLDEVPSF
ncbi:uncharacterized protein Ecym_1114 [Eremothecium cymbalariae DBVPG|uniref:Alpha box domain-containing protein n=1 Tax=Eremothecium cymbalariae (strain CBS 270.75 / DBVPG 7215 / KCTC 17166 / NRRL Y-17582) TaxID=931890 RepID=G8JM03_ERECY|nr:hypothetical protein Ecym_1003 [Eremothecium cymbalariae DBVPG\